MRQRHDLSPFGVAFASGGKPLLQPSDFTYLGSYPVAGGGGVGNGLGSGNGLVLRYVGGQLRFLTQAYNGGAYDLVEFTLPGSFGTYINSRVTRWAGAGLWAKTPDNQSPRAATGLFWDPNTAGLLWSVWGPDYPSSTYHENDPSNNNYYWSVQTRQLTDGNPGTVSGLTGLFGFTGINSRFVKGGVQPVPSWVQTQYGVGPYAYGWGGYQSTKTVGPVSFGLAMLLGKAITTYSNPNTLIPTVDFKIAADHRAAAITGDWYTNPGSPSQLDRGQRASDVLNYFNDPSYPSNPATFPAGYGNPHTGSQWLSPAPDGQGRWVDGDNYWSTGVSIDGPNKQGFLAVGWTSTGKAYYAGSTINFDGKHAELHCFDWNMLGKAATGQLNPWNVQPSWAKLLDADLKPLGPQVLTAGYQSGLGGPGTGVGAAVFDPTTKRLYAWIPAAQTSGDCALACYSVNC